MAAYLGSNKVAGMDASKQDTLISGENIKTINGESILGSGNITLMCEEYLGSNPDIDLLRERSGVYGLYNSPKAPVTNIGTLEVMRYSWDWVVQRYTEISTGRVWERVFYSGTTWSEWFHILTSTTLYSNSSGTKGTITLSKSTANFSYIEIFFDKYGTNKMWNSIKVFEPDGKNVALLTAAQLSSTSIQFQASTAAISGDTITRAGGGANVTSSSNEVFTSTEVAIYKVVGYR